MTNKKVLVTYFSRTGEQYSVGTITQGNTALLAEIIAKNMKADLFEIKVKNDSYPTTYNELIAVAKKEKQLQTRPELAQTVSNFTDYDIVFIGYPNWWGEMPMAIYTFLESLPWDNKIVVPFCTHEGSGFAGTDSKIRTVTGATLLSGFAAYGHEVQNMPQKIEQEVLNWLQKIGLMI